MSLYPYDELGTNPCDKEEPIDESPAEGGDGEKERTLIRVKSRACENDLHADCRRQDCVCACHTKSAPQAPEEAVATREQAVELLARYIAARSSSMWVYENDELERLHEIERAEYSKHRYTHPEGFSGASREALKTVIRAAQPSPDSGEGSEPFVTKRFVNIYKENGYLKAGNAWRKRESAEESQDIAKMHLGVVEIDFYITDEIRAALSSKGVGR